MKKLLAVGLFLILVALGLLLYRMQKQKPIAQSLVPAETALFVHFPDIAQSRIDWRKTALFQIYHEPEVQAFLARPRAKVPQAAKAHEQIDRIRHIDPREAFAALASISSPGPIGLAGLRFGGKQADVESWWRDLKTHLQSAWPAGKSDLLNHRGIPIETFSADQFSLMSAFHKKWLLMSNDLTSLKVMLDRLDERGTPEQELRGNPLFKKAIAKMPAGHEALVFAQMQKITERLIPLLTATGQATDPAQIEKLKKIQAMIGATNFQDEQVRDTLFVIRDGAAKQAPMPRHSLAFTAADSLVYYAAIPEFPNSFKMPNPALDTTGILARLEKLQQALAQHGLSAADFAVAFGPEFASVIDWPANAQQPSLLLTLDVKDRVRAQKALDFLASGEGGLPVWAKQGISGTDFYVLTTTTLPVLTPALALTDKFLLFGLNFESLKAAVGRGKSPGGKLDSNANYTNAGKQVIEPTRAFGYIDSRALFDRVYGTLRPFVVMWSSFVPRMSDYVDISKLPATETITKHLGPIAYSQSSSDEGELAESIGTVTFGQAAFGFGIGAGIALVPTLKAALSAPRPPVPGTVVPAISPPASAPLASPSAEPETTPVAEPSAM